MRIKIYITEMEITKLQFSLCELLKFKTIMDNTIGQKDKNILKRKFGFINIDNGKELSNKETKTQLWIEINHTHFEIRKFYSIRKIIKTFRNRNKTIKKSSKKKFIIKKKISCNNIEMEKDNHYQQIKNSKHWGLTWLEKVHKCKNRKNCNCIRPIDLLQKYKKKNEILIHSKYKGCYYFSKTTKKNFLKLLKKNRSFFETIKEDTQRRLYIDIDGKNKEKDKGKRIKDQFPKTGEFH